MKKQTILIFCLLFFMQKNIYGMNFETRESTKEFKYDNENVSLSTNIEYETIENNNGKEQINIEKKENALDIFKSTNPYMTTSFVSTIIITIGIGTFLYTKYEKEENLNNEKTKS